MPVVSPPLPNKHQRAVTWSNLAGSAYALALTEAMRADSRLFVVIVPDARELERLSSEVQFFTAGKAPLLRFPDWEVLPYDLFSPHSDITSERLRTLYELPQLRRGCLMIAADTLMQRLPPTNYVHARAFELKAGDVLDLDNFRARLIAAGYAAVSQVGSPGEFAARGSLLDVFPMGSSQPLRIDLFDQEIESIKCFDPDTQRSLQTWDGAQLLPAREVPLDEAAVKEFRRRFRLRFSGDTQRMSVYQDIREGLPPAGIEFYLPLFFPTTATLLDYLPQNAVFVFHNDLADNMQQNWHDIELRYEERRHDIERPLLPPAELFVPPAELRQALDAFGTVHIDLNTDNSFNLHADGRIEQPLQPLLEFSRGFDGKVLLVAESPGRRAVLQEMLSTHQQEYAVLNNWPEFVASDERFALTVGGDIRGLLAPDAKVALISEAQVFGARANQERRRKRSRLDPEAILRDLQDLTTGAPVVHEEYGVGRFVGLQPMAVADQQGEFLVLEYQGGDRVYIPVHALHLVSRYTGAAPEQAPLHKLGTDQWSKARRRAAEQIRDVAAELLDLHARRRAQRGLRLDFDNAEYQRFAASFPFEETADQQQAITQVLTDLHSDRPMDRIVCGDVGFGKTEVAMRAAFAATQAGKQVVVLVPTTLLAQQHLANFRDRFADWPIRIASLSRFGTQRETQATLHGLEHGSIDIVIATHRLLHAQPRVKDLGLIIVDEEHRFGVRDKEKLQTLRAEVHVLTLTATPIPRTLNMALGGLRDLSLMTTPPAQRLAIKTFLGEWHGPTLREAVLRELRRGGQIYFVHNEVKSIEKTAADVQTLVPEAQIRVGHGQMRERELEQLMVDFYHRRFNVLVCTTIIESGIDVPTANTIMINRADRFGLAQLHQLRGRVGRSHHRAYAYLIVPTLKALNDDAVKRLEALTSMEALGAGFVLATHDLEIRGAGELLGEQQSGQMTEIGLSLYLDMLDQAVKALKEGREPALDKPLAAATEIELRLPAFIPDDYISDVHLRLSLYKHIAAAPSGEAIDEIATEMVDRFGVLPEPLQTLLRITRLKLSARQLGVRRLDLGAQGGYLAFEEKNQVNPAAIIQLIQNKPREYRLEGPLKLRVHAQIPADEVRSRFAAQLLQTLRSS
jgi:transcription-repair coupling factor (superfamily II helicase)